MERMTIFSLLLMLFPAFFLLSCSNSETTVKEYSSLEDVTPEDWKTLSKKRIYFGHQSVGYNILDGIDMILQQHDGANLKIVEVESNLPEKGGFFAHSRIGRNTHPDEKITAFEAFVDENAKNQPEIAFLKLCYVDIRADSDINAIFKEYSSTMDRLEKKYPDVKFLHFTVPLVQKPAGFKALKQWVKGVLGKTRYGIDDNIKRCDYNEMLRNQYETSGNLFDLAAYESTFPDGSRAGFEIDGKTYYSLVPEYTSDGGHLNETGKKVIAEKLLLSLI